MRPVANATAVSQSVNRLIAPTSNRPKGPMPTCVPCRDGARLHGRATRIPDPAPRASPREGPQVDYAGTGSLQPSSSSTVQPRACASAKVLSAGGM